MSALPPMFKASALLGLASVLGVGLVAWVHSQTGARIAANERAVLQSALEELVPAGSFDNDPLTDTMAVEDALLDPRRPVTVYRARRRGRPVAAVLSPVAPDGYNGTIKLLVAVRADGVLTGVRVVDHRETPGLGDPIDLDKSNWVVGFKGRSLDNPPAARWKVKKDGGDFDQFAGATVTPRAVVKAVKQSLAFYAQNRDWLYDPDGRRPE